MTMVDLFKHLGHTTRTVAKDIVQELEKGGVVNCKTLEGSGAEQTNGNSLTHFTYLNFTQMGV